MSSLRRIESSRLNGARSRGPITAEGKARSARNATRHGILAKEICLDGELLDQFVELSASLTDEFQPRTPVEELLVEMMVVAKWRQWRTWTYQQLEMNTATRKQSQAHHASVRGMMAFRNLAADGTALNTLLRYDLTYERQFFRALKKLQELQAARPEIMDVEEALPPPASGTYENRLPPNEPSPISEQYMEWEPNPLEPQPPQPPPPSQAPELPGAS